MTDRQTQRKDALKMFILAKQLKKLARRYHRTEWEIFAEELKLEALETLL